LLAFLLRASLGLRQGKRREFEKMKNFLVVIGAIVLAPFLIVSAVMWRGYALCLMWGWFFVPSFGLPALSIPAAIGVSSIISFIIPSYPTDYMKEKDEDEKWEGLIKSALRNYGAPALFLLFGYIVKQWMPH
jgi:hypothetical protein